MALLASPLAVALPATADDQPCTIDIFHECETDPDAVTIGLMTRDEVLALEQFPGDNGGPIVDRPKNAPVYEYVSLNDCPQAKPDSMTEQVSCAHALRDCPEGEARPPSSYLATHHDGRRGDRALAHTRPHLRVRRRTGRPADVDDG